MAPANNHRETAKAGAANEKTEPRSPVVWGARMGERISFSVMAGKLWAHVYVGGKKRASIGIRPAEAAPLGLIGDQGAKLAQEQDEQWRAQQAQRRYEDVLFQGA